MISEEAAKDMTQKKKGTRRAKCRIAIKLPEVAHFPAAIGKSHLQVLAVHSTNKYHLKTPALLWYLVMRSSISLKTDVKAEY